MLLSIPREKSTDKSTAGALFIDKQLHCFTLEDVVRVGTDGVMQKEEKVYGRTAIPAGKYKVTLEAFRGDKNRMYPHLQNVPYFVGVAMHGGNTDEDTLGCILVGNRRRVDWVGDCAGALSGLCYRIKTTLDNQGEVWLEITDYKEKKK